MPAEASYDAQAMGRPSPAGLRILHSHLPHVGPSWEHHLKRIKANLKDPMTAFCEEYPDLSPVAATRLAHLLLRPRKLAVHQPFMEAVRENAAAMHALTALLATAVRDGIDDHHLVTHVDEALTAAFGKPVTTADPAATWKDSAGAPASPADGQLSTDGKAVAALQSALGSGGRAPALYDAAVTALAAVFARGRDPAEVRHCASLVQALDRQAKAKDPEPGLPVALLVAERPDVVADFAMDVLTMAETVTEFYDRHRVGRLLEVVSKDDPGSTGLGVIAKGSRKDVSEAFQKAASDGYPAEVRVHLAGLKERQAAEEEAQLQREAAQALRDRERKEKEQLKQLANAKKQRDKASKLLQQKTAFQTKLDNKLTALQTSAQEAAEAAKLAQEASDAADAAVTALEEQLGQLAPEAREAAAVAANYAAYAGQCAAEAASLLARVSLAAI